MFNEIVEMIHENEIDQEWWEKERSFGEIIALCHLELSEALKEYRNERPLVWYACNPYDIFNGCKNMKHCKNEVSNTRCTNITDFCRYKHSKPEGIVIELVDCVIRILDFFGHCNVDIDQHMKESENEYFYEHYEPKDKFGELVTECHYFLSEAYIYKKLSYIRDFAYNSLMKVILIIKKYIEKAGYNLIELLEKRIIS
jgi:hypothetical protein